MSSTEGRSVESTRRGAAVEKELTYLGPQRDSAGPAAMLQARLFAGITKVPG